LWLILQLIMILENKLSTLLDPQSFFFHLDFQKMPIVHNMFLIHQLITYFNI
jgi:hypothetical protein